MNETALLSAAVFDRAAWEQVVDHVTPEDLTAHARIMWAAICAYYDRDPSASAVLPEVLLATLEREHPRHAEDFVLMVSALSPEFGTANVAREVLNLKRDAAGEALQLALSARKGPEVLAPLLTAYADINAATGLMDTGVVPIFGTSLAEIITKTEAPGARWKLLPNGLNAMLRGGLLPGHCVVVFGRVNVGKSAFAINATAGFLRQGATVLYVENEDLLEDTALRVGCRLVGWTRDQAAADPERFEKGAASRGYGRLILPDPAPATPDGIEKLVMARRPDIVVVNQARNLTIGHKDSVQQMDQIAKSLRNIGKRHRVVMLLVTAANEGEKDRSGKVQEKWILEKADCYSSRTGFPAVADVMVGYGTSAALNERGMACLSLAKTKLGGKGKDGDVLYVHVDYATGKIKG